MNRCKEEWKIDKVTAGHHRHHHRTLHDHLYADEHVYDVHLSSCSTFGISTSPEILGQDMLPTPVVSQIWPEISIFCNLECTLFVPPPRGDFAQIQARASVPGLAPDFPKEGITVRGRGEDR